MATRDSNSLTLEGVQLIFRNFAGKEGQFNREGDRNFSILLDDDTAVRMVQQGWNVKALKARGEDGVEQPYITVNVGFKGRPPRLVMITSRGRTNLTEEEVEMLDWVDVAFADVILNPYSWAIGEKTGVKAYLKAIYVTIDEDDLELKYADLPATPAQARD